MADALIDSQVPAKSGGAGMLKKSFPGLSFLDNLSEMTMLRQIGLLVGLAASVAIGFAVVLWSQQPDYKPLYGSLNGVDANRVVEALTAADIPYKVEPNSGALLVKADDLGRARMKVASAGVAPTDNNVGFEILDKEQALGTSQFMEATNYRRGLEGELARTVSSLNNVKAARVHLAIPKSSVFVRDDRKPSASVLVELYPGRSLEPSQVMAIVNLVATSVPELDKSQVTVVDQKGNLLSDQQELSELTMAGKQFDFTRRMEGLLTQRVHNILQPVLGNGRYKAEVSADVDFSAVESTSEMYNPDQPALRSEQRNNEERQNSSGPQGVPGALSNQPPGPASAPQQATASAPADYVAPGQPLKDANGQTIIDPKTGKPELAPYPTDKRDQTTRNYELDRSISYTKQQQGALAPTVGGGGAGRPDEGRREDRRGQPPALERRRTGALHPPGTGFGGLRRQPRRQRQRDQRAVRPGPGRRDRQHSVLLAAVVLGHRQAGARRAVHPGLGVRCAASGAEQHHRRRQGQVAGRRRRSRRRPGAGREWPGRLAGRRPGEHRRAVEHPPAEPHGGV